MDRETRDYIDAATERVQNHAKRNHAQAIGEHAEQNREAFKRLEATDREQWGHLKQLDTQVAEANVARARLEGRVNTYESLAGQQYDALRNDLAELKAQLSERPSALNPAWTKLIYAGAALVLALAGAVAAMYGLPQPAVPAPVQTQPRAAEEPRDIRWDRAKRRAREPRHEQPGPP